MGCVVSGMGWLLLPWKVKVEVGLDECFPACLSSQSSCGHNSELRVVALLARRRERWGGKQRSG